MKKVILNALNVAKNILKKITKLGGYKNGNERRIT